MHRYEKERLYQCRERQYEGISRKGYVVLKRIVAESAVVAFATLALGPKSAGNQSHLILFQKS